MESSTWSVIDGTRRCNFLDFHSFVSQRGGVFRWRPLELRMTEPITLIASGLFCLATNLYHEARGEPIEGQFAVSLTTLNRAKGDITKVCKVVYAKKQFSWTNKKPYPPVTDLKAFREAQAVARLSLHMRDFTGGADHYHRLDMVPYPDWAPTMTVVGTWGDHVFYRSK